MNKRLMIIIVVILVILLGIGIYFGVRSNNANKYKTADVYTVKGEEIASVKAAIGEKKVKKYSYDKEDTETLELTFEDKLNEFLHQEITWEKVHNFLFQEISFKKSK